MNIARLFSYTRLLERELIRERRRHERERAADRAQWNAERSALEEERHRLQNVVFVSRGVSAPHAPARTAPETKTIPRAIGPIGDFGLAARNATLREEQEGEKDRVTRAVPPKPELSEADQERIRRSAEEKGVRLVGT